MRLCVKVVLHGQSKARHTGVASLRNYRCMDCHVQRPRGMFLVWALRSARADWFGLGGRYLQGSEERLAALLFGLRWGFGLGRGWFFRRGPIFKARDRSKIKADARAEGNARALQRFENTDFWMHGEIIPDAELKTEPAPEQSSPYC
jgi:hypothetical protein